MAHLIQAEDIAHIPLVKVEHNNYILDNVKDEKIDMLEDENVHTSGTNGVSHLQHDKLISIYEDDTEIKREVIDIHEKFIEDDVEHENLKELFTKEKNNISNGRMKNICKKSHELSGGKYNVRSNKTGIKEHKRESCEFTTRKRYNLRKRVNSVHMNSTEQCFFCNYNTVKKYDLEKHLETVHMEIKQQKCPTCDYKASNKSALKTHINGVHLNLLEFECPLCNYKARLNSMVKKHINELHKKQMKYKCDFCEYRTHLNYFLEKHMSVHEEFEEHKCELCEYTSCHKSNLIRHVDVIHTKLMHHICEFCGYVTDLMSNLKRHVMSVHDDECMED